MARTTNEAVIRTAQALTGERRSDVAAMFDLVVRLCNHLATRCLSAAGLVIGSSDPAKVKIANTVTYLVNGVFKSKTTAEVTMPAGMTMASTTAIRERYGVITLPAGGTPTVTPGTMAGSGLAVLPATTDLPADEAIIGYIKVVAAANTVYTAGTTNMDASGITTTYFDVAWIDRDFPNFSALQ